jgi:hypothetical protein
MRFSFIIFSVLLASYGLAAPVSQPEASVDLTDVAEVADLSVPDISARSPIGNVKVGDIVKVAPKHVSGLPILKGKNGKAKAVRFTKISPQVSPLIRELV